MSSDDRIILTQLYNILIENWDDTFERTKKLIDIQDSVNNSSNLTPSAKEEISKLIDTILVGDAQSTDEVTVAIKVIESLIPVTSTNHATIIEKIEAIKSHPDNLTLNKELGKSILEMVQKDSTIDEKYKLMIRSQLSIIVNGGQASVPASEIPEEVSSTSGGILGFIIGTVKVFGIIILIIIIIILIGFVVYRVSKKKNDIGFQDFLIDSIFHSKSTTGTSSKTVEQVNIKTNSSTANSIPTVKTDILETSESQPYQDPLSTLPKSYTNSDSSINNSLDHSSNEAENIVPKIEEHTATIPDWLKVPTPSENKEETSNKLPLIESNNSVDPLMDTLSSSKYTAPEADTTESTREDGSISGMGGISQDMEPTSSSPLSVIGNMKSESEDANLPDWLKGSLHGESNEVGNTFIDAIPSEIVPEEIGTIEKKEDAKENAESIISSSNESGTVK